MLSDLPYRQWLAAGAFSLIALSDGLDGYLARSLNQVTSFGKILDPLADKLVIIAALLTLVKISNLPLWIVIIILSREIIVSGLRLFAVQKNVIISASSLGKAKTVFQVLAIIAWILNSHQSIYLFNMFSWMLILIAVFLTLFSALNYLIRFKQLWTLE